jgi:hypothetical protein
MAVYEEDQTHSETNHFHYHPRKCLQIKKNRKQDALEMKRENKEMQK